MNNKSYFENILKNKQIPTVIVFLLCLAGIVAFLTMPRQQFPEFSVLEGLVIAGYPGASSEQVDAQVTKPLLDYLFQFEQVDRTQTYTVTKENQCVVFLYVVKGLKGSQIDVFWSKLRIGLNEFKVDLPAQVLLLEGDNDFGKTSAVLLSISSEERSYRELESYLNKLSDMITAYPAVASVEKYGVQKEKVTVYVDRQSLAFYGIEPAVLISLFQLESLAEYGAKIETPTVTLPIHIGRQYASDAELADQVIWSAPSGNVVRLKDIARIERGYDIDGAFVESDGMRAVALSMEMAGGNNIVEFGKRVDKIIETFKNGAPGDIKIVKISDMPGIVNTSINHFFRDFAIAIASVVIVIILSLPLHIAAVSAFTIPISMLIGMLVLRFMGMELNTVTLASLVLVLGMVVDDSLVVIDNHIEKLDHGMDLWTASYRSAEETRMRHRPQQYI
ncbi:hypothetical protein FACS189494_11210 [Spirochaetia bacterium]|nr:hypothetical protein FACS189494_11210 [Spirochaetia bacterium]